VLIFPASRNEFLWALFVLFSPAARAAAGPGHAAARLQHRLQPDHGVVASIPVLILFVIAQRFIIEGLSRTAIKG
jgi:multiple sugar transport system permease protein